MNEEKTKKALQQLSRREGLSLDTVHQAIVLAIAAARENPEEHIQALWQAVPCQGESPTPEEAIAYIAAIVDHNGGIR